MKNSAFYVLDIDQKNEVVTLGFLQERFIANNPDELSVLADVIGQLSQSLNELLQHGLQDDNPDADYEAIDLAEIASQLAIPCDKHKCEQYNVSSGQ